MTDLTNKNVIHVKKCGIEYLQFRRLLEYKDRVLHAYSLGIEKSYRVAKEEKRNLVEEAKKTQQNYKTFCQEIGVNYNSLIYSNQFHTDNIECIYERTNFNKIEVDGLCTNIKNLPLSTINADCILFLFYDPKKNVIANIHSGWKGTIQRISTKAIIKMEKEYGCNPKDIICCISPSIRKCHFEVRKEVKDLFNREFIDIGNLQEIIEEKTPNEKWNIDTVLLNKIILTKAGLEESNIIDSGICTVCNKDIIHSYRIEKQGYGVETAIIGLI